MPGLATEGFGGAADSPPHLSFEYLASLAGHASEFWLNHFSRRLVALLLAGLIIQGCSLKQPIPAKQSFLLEPVRTGEVRTVESLVQLRLRNLQVAAPFEGKGFVYRTSGLGYKSDFYNEFLTAPRTLIAGQLQTWLGASKIFRNVLPPGITLEATHALDGTISALYGDFQNPSAPKAVVAAEFFLSSDQTSLSEIVFHKNYRQEIAIDGRQPEALAKGWTEALARIFASLEQDLVLAKVQIK